MIHGPEMLINFTFYLSEDISEEMITLSLASGVISRLTALVGVDQEGKAVSRGDDDMV